MVLDWKVSDAVALRTAPAMAEAQTAEMAARAASAHVKAVGDVLDVHAKPLEAAHSVVDLHNKLNPPDPSGPDGDEPKG